MSQYLSWHVGMKVVCVSSSTTYVKRLVVGKIYTLREILAHPETGEIGVYLEEVENHIHHRFGIECGYYASSFRPVQPRKTDISIFTAMLNPAKKREVA